MASKKISVLLPVYNVEKHLQKCVNYLKNQTYQNLEIIFVDDKSTDNSLQVLKELTANMPNVKIIEHEQNKGLLYARLTGLLNCTGDYIHFLDSDDFVDLDFYESYIEKLNQEQPDICFCLYKKASKNLVPRLTINNGKDFNITGDNYECMNFLFQKSLFSLCYHYMWTKIISKELWEKSKNDLVEIINKAGYILGGEEYIFNIVLYSKAKKIINHQGSRVYYCQHEEQSIRLNNKNLLFKQTDSLIRANISARNYAIKNNIYKLYYKKDVEFISTIKTNRQFAVRLKCIKEFDELINKYDFDSVYKKVTLLYESL